jgi:TRAP transporter TAXI family solute receptor
LLERAVPAIDCSVLPKPEGDATDSLASIVNLRDGTTELGIAESDWVHFAFHGTGPVLYMHSKFDFLRSLFSIDIRPFTLLAKRGSGIEAVGDLAGRRVNLGRLYSEARAGMDMVLEAKGWSKSDFALAEELTTAEQSFSFCNDWVEAIHYLTTHPSTIVSRLVKLCDAVLVDVGGPEIDTLIAARPYLTATTIPGGTYERAPEPVKTFGTTVTVLSSVDVSEETVYTVVKTVFENLPALRRTHPTLRHLVPESMAKGGLAAPLHDGAKRYYEERGWL